MSLGNYGASPTATRRIRFFSVGTWVVAAIAALFMTGANTANINIAEYSYDAPWEDPNAAVAVDEGDHEWSGDGDALIHLSSADNPDGGLTAELVTGEYLNLYFGPNDPENDLPAYGGGVYAGDASTLVVQAGELDVWVRTDDPWRIRLTPIEAIQFEDSHSSKGDALLVYTGTAKSANVRYVGDGIFVLHTYTSDGRDSPIIEADTFTDRVIWGGGDTVYFDIESDGDRGAWTIDIEELAQPSPAATPSSTPSSTATPNAGG